MDKIFQSRMRKLFLFIGSYAIANLFLYIYFACRDGFDFLTDFDEVFILLVFFSAGFGWPILHQLPEKYAGFSYLGWFVYPAIMVYAVGIKNIRASKIMYLIFILLLILNVGGCTIGIEDLAFPIP